MAFALVTLLALVAASCARSPTAPDVSPSETGTATLELLGITPPPGTQLSQDSVVVADLAYSITNVAGFRRGDYFILAQVETTDPTMTTDGSFPSDAYPVPQAPTGSLTFSFPVRHVWNEPRVSPPFRIWFYLNQYIGPDRRSRVIARAGPLEYEAR
jgi:hypothetical protein